MGGEAVREEGGEGGGAQRWSRSAGEGGREERICHGRVTTAAIYIAAYCCGLLQEAASLLHQLPPVFKTIEANRKGSMQ